MTVIGSASVMIPENMVAQPMTCPATVLGDISPYPTVVIYMYCTSQVMVDNKLSVARM